MENKQNRLKSRQRNVGRQGERKGTPMIRGWRVFPRHTHPQWCMCPICLPAERRPVPPTPPRPTPTVSSYLNAAIKRKIGWYGDEREPVLREYRLVVGEKATLENN